MRGVEHRLLLFEGAAYETFNKDCQALQKLASELCIEPQPIKICADNAALHLSYKVTEPTVFLIRPDGYIGYRGKLGEPDGFEQYVRHLYSSQVSGAQVGDVQVSDAQVSDAEKAPEKLNA